MVQRLVGVGPDKVLVGVTGTFGSGKSTVAKILEALGAYVLDTDALGHEALLRESSVYGEVVSEFPEACGGNGGLDRRKIAEIVFCDSERRKKLEYIVHPYVFERIVKEVTGTRAKIIVLEIPLLFETGYDQFCHFKVVVSAPEKVVVERVRKKGFSMEEVRARIKTQLSLEEKCKRADVIIDNANSVEETRCEVEGKLWPKLRPFLKGEK